MLYRDPAPLKRGTALPLFGPCLLWLNGWMDQDSTWYGVDLGAGHIVLDGAQMSPGKGHSSPTLSAHVYCGQTVAHLS